MSANLHLVSSATALAGQSSATTDGPVSGPPPAVDPVVLERASCPLCHTIERALPDNAVRNADEWRCERCGQGWSGRRIATVAAYAVWESHHLDRPGGNS